MDILSLPGQSAPADKVRFVNSRFTNAIDATCKKRERLYDNLYYYFGDQLPDPIRKAKSKNRPPIIYNITQRKITGLVGSLMRNNFHVTYVSLDGMQTSLIHALQDMLAADMNSGNWDWNFMSYLKYGLIQEGIMELTTNLRESPLGNLCFECCQPGSIVIDPNWRTESSRDIREAFKYTYMLPAQIMEIWPDATDSIKANLMSKLRSNQTYDNRESSGFNADYAYSLGDQYMVLQYYYLKEEMVVKEVDIPSMIELPKTDDTALKQRWCELNGIDIANVRGTVVPQRVCQVVTILPGLMSDQPLEDKPHELQIDRIPFFPFSAERINGDVNSIVDIMKPLQDTLNRRENQMDAILANSASGACAIDPDIVDNDEKMKDMIRNGWAQPDFKFWTARGKLASGKEFMKELPHSAPPTEILNQINHFWEGLDRVLPINAAADGRSESATESGVLFNMKENAIEAAQQTLVLSIESALTEMGDAYMRAVKSYYSNVERTFVKPDHTSFKINEVVPLPTGDIGIRNDISSLQNLRTLVKLGPDSPNARFTKRLQSLDILNRIPQNMPQLQVRVIQQIFGTLDLDDDDKHKIDEAIESEIKNAQALEAAQLAQYGAAAAMQGMQAQKAVAQMQQAQQPPQPGAAPGGAPGAPGGLGAMVAAAQAQHPPAPKVNPLASLTAKPGQPGAAPPTGRFAIARANPLGPLVKG
jgi:hypothetical protein